MRVVKKIQGHKILSKVFDEVLFKLWHKLFLSRLEIILTNYHGYEINGRTARIFFDKNEEYLKNEDERGIKAILAHQFFHIILRLRGFSTKHHLIEDVMANREAIKHGFGNELFYHMYNTLIKKKNVKSFEEYLFLHVPWLSFHTIDEHAKNFLRDLLRHVNYPKSFDTKSKKIIKKLKSKSFDEELVKKLERYLNANNKI